jgi:DNA replication protein DnaC
VVPYLVEHILPARKPTILYGAGGVGKSIFAASLAVAVQEGNAFLGKHVEQAEVLYLDWETDEEDIAARVMAAAYGMGLTHMPSVRYSALVRPLEDRVTALARYVAEHNIGLVVIDSVGLNPRTQRSRLRLRFHAGIARARQRSLGVCRGSFVVRT